MNDSVCRLIPTPRDEKLKEFEHQSRVMQMYISSTSFGTTTGKT